MSNLRKPSLSEDSVKNCNENEKFMFLQLLTFRSKYSKKLLLHEKVLDIHSIRLLRNSEDFRRSPCNSFLKSLKLVECENFSYKLVYLDNMLILLDNLSYSQDLLEVFFDPRLNYLFLILANGQTDIFQFEVQNIHQIIFSDVDYSTGFEYKDEIHLALLNSIQMNIHFLESRMPEFDDSFPMDIMQHDYLQGFNRANDFSFFKNSSVVRNSNFNDYLVFHSMFFYNNFSSSIVDFNQLQTNSKFLIKDFFKIFKNKLKSAESKVVSFKI